MPAALPMALRARFQDYITEGLSGRAAASAFEGFKQPLVFAGFERFASEGKSRLKRKDAPKGMVSSHPHRALLEELVAQDGDVTLPELAGALEAATGVVAHSASCSSSGFLEPLGI